MVIVSMKRSVVTVGASLMLVHACGQPSTHLASPTPTSADAGYHSQSPSATMDDAAPSAKAKQADSGTLPQLPKSCTKDFSSQVEDLSYSEYVEKNRPSHVGTCGDHLVIRPRMGILLFYESGGRQVATATFADFLEPPCLGKKYFGPVPTACEVVLEDIRSEMEKTMPGIW